MYAALLHISLCVYACTRVALWYRNLLRGVPDLVGLYNGNVCGYIYHGRPKGFRIVAPGPRVVVFYLFSKVPNQERLHFLQTTSSNGRLDASHINIFCRPALLLWSYLIDRRLARERQRCHHPAMDERCDSSGLGPGTPEDEYRARRWSFCTKKQGGIHDG